VLLGDSEVGVQFNVSVIWGSRS